MTDFAHRQAAGQAAIDETADLLSAAGWDKPL